MREAKAYAVGDRVVLRGSGGGRGVIEQLHGQNRPGRYPTAVVRVDGSWVHHHVSTAFLERESEVRS